MAELLYKMSLNADLNFVRNYRRTDRNSEPDFRKHFRVFTSPEQGNRTTPFRAMLATTHDFHVDFDVEGDIGPGRAPTVRDSHNGLRHKRSDEFVNEGRTNPTT
jgi:hypothetical protein